MLLTLRPLNAYNLSNLMFYQRLGHNGIQQRNDPPLIGTLSREVNKR